MPLGWSTGELGNSLNPLTPIQIVEICGLEKDKSCPFSNNQVIIKGVCKRTNEKKKRTFVAFYNPNTRKGKVKII